jgi:hypothetical protein
MFVSWFLVRRLISIRFSCRSPQAQVKSAALLSFLDSKAVWRGVRAVEGARLESVYMANPRIAGSNPALSAIN